MLTVLTVNDLDGLHMCCVCLPTTLKGQMVIIQDSLAYCKHVCMLLCLLLHECTSEIISVCLQYVQSIQESFCADEGSTAAHEIGGISALINGNRHEITDTQFASVSAVAQRRRDKEQIF